MSLILDLLRELSSMFWADRRLNIGLLSVTGVVVVLSWIDPILRSGVLPAILAFSYAGVIGLTIRGPDY